MDNTNCVPTDTLIPDKIDDTVQCLKWYPSANNICLASCGWDSTVRLWNVQCSTSSNYYNNTTVTMQTKMIYSNTFQAPLLSLAWRNESSVLFTGDSEGSIHAIDISTAQTSVIGKHQAGCKELAWVDKNLNILLSAGWDGYLNFWDLRQQNPVLSLNLGKKVFTMSLTYPLLVVGLDQRVINYFNLSKLTGSNFTKEAEFESHLKYQTRCICNFNEPNGYALGSIEGRVAVKNLDLNKNPSIDLNNKTMNEPNDFAFRCHRSGNNNQDVYPVNAIAFNHVYGTFTTGGGDGCFFIWDKDSKSRLKQGFYTDKAPIVALDYAYNGDILAYASGYDWSKGYNYNNTYPNQIGLHYLVEAEKKKKGKGVK